MKKSESAYVSGSPIHGKGLFASHRINRNTHIGTFEGKSTKRDGTYVLWIYDDDDSLTGKRGTNNLRYLNHGKTPNAEFEGFELYAIKMIRKDDEILIDYGW